MPAQSWLSAWVSQHGGSNARRASPFGFAMNPTDTAVLMKPLSAINVIPFIDIMLMLLASLLNRVSKPSSSHAADASARR
jgi:hypothetical protein